ncbi:MAG: L-serine ammonia-lyase [Desulfovibrio sp.]|uniref:L-serine ammonia-lyase n=1 Tax=Desulfovibrio sp. TaxID=885 RepID=UPI002A362261|nr:L-serine ammonia-lyase [Desulfovibrio sp.]MDY0258992.1 L-serine ammonia-lyase [Desulfovibrio sp.]
MLSVFDLFKIGIGPSSSHTVGPMVAGKAFAGELALLGLLPCIGRVTIDLFGSLALTGEGHGTTGAILGGLEGEEPASVDTARLARRTAELQNNADLTLICAHTIPFDYARDMRLHKGMFLPRHSNAMRLTAHAADGTEVYTRTYYSIGGGFIRTDADFDAETETWPTPPYPYKTAGELFAICEREGKTVAQIVMTNESFWHTAAEVRRRAQAVMDVMRDSVERGCYTDGVLPGGYNVRRRAPNLLRKVSALQAQGRRDLSLWPTLYAFAVAEENASGGRVVTAPTNGAAGVVPAVLTYYQNFYPHATEEGALDFLLTAGAIGLFYKTNASISGAEVGCQGEVGVACSMAAGAYCAVTGGNVKQVEVAAEIGMEHNLGLTCDPVGGLVQIPCIERNGVAAERAVNCAQLSRLEDGRQRVISLDAIIEVMYRTGLDLQSRYKETSLGGLAQAVAEGLERKKQGDTA